MRSSNPSRRKLLATLVATAALSGCAGLTSTPGASPPATGPWLVRRVPLESLQRWDITGRISVIQGDEGWHGSVRWRQTVNGYAIDMVGPLGQGRIAIDGDDRQVRLQTGDGRELIAASADNLLREATGLAVPIDGLFYWIRGLPAPGDTTELTGDEEGRLTRLVQDGWAIEFTRYTAVEDLQLPVRIVAQQDDLQVKLAINSWDLAT